MLFIRTYFDTKGVMLDCLKRPNPHHYSTKMAEFLKSKLITPNINSNSRVVCVIRHNFRFDNSFLFNY